MTLTESLRGGATLQIILKDQYYPHIKTKK